MNELPLRMTLLIGVKGGNMFGCFHLFRTGASSLLRVLIAAVAHWVQWTLWVSSSQCSPWSPWSPWISWIPQISRIPQILVDSMDLHGDGVYGRHGLHGFNGIHRLCGFNNLRSPWALHGVYGLPGGLENGDIQQHCKKMNEKREHNQIIKINYQHPWGPWASWCPRQRWNSANV